MTDLNAKRSVLDHGYVQYIAHMGDDDTALEAARMSTGRETGVDIVKDDALRLRLWRDQHTSPFEMADLVVEIQCPIFVLRQIDRHRSVDYDGTTIESEDENARQFTSRNEFSGRYSTMMDLFFIPPTERIQKKGVANKQGSEGALDPETQEKMQGLLKISAGRARADYEELIARGVSSEIARVALPLNQYTKLRMKGSLLTWFKILNSRLRLDVQLETRLFFHEIAKIVRRLWPKTWAIFEEYTLYAVTLSRGERAVLSGTVLESEVGGVTTWAKYMHPEQPIRGLVPEGD